MGEPRVRVQFAPQGRPQLAFLQSPFDITVYGGSRGGGKTFASLGDFWLHAELYNQAAKGLMIRKTREDLKDAIATAVGMYGTAAQWIEKGSYFRFQGGGRLYMAYLERDADAQNYQGWSLTRVYIEELTQFASPAPIFKLLATLRSSSGVRCQMKCTCNPGGPGHHWVKSWIVDLGAYRPATDPETGITRVFVPARIIDNPALLANDPRYIDRLKSVGSPELVRAWLDGDWNIIEGAFFPEFTTARHVIKPFAIPGHWTRFRSMDWGSASPFSVGWWAVVQDDYYLADDRRLPRGAIVRYREWYGASAPNVGLKLPAEAVAAGIVQRETDRKGHREQVAYGVLDPSAFAVISGPSIAETMMRAGVTFRRADNSRLSVPKRMGGWDQVRWRLRGEPDGDPMLFIFDTCRDLIRTLPMMQHDDHNAEDLDTDGEDHCFTSDTLVRTSKGLYSFKELIGTEGIVRSHDGAYHPFQSVRLVKRDQSVVRLTFSDGMTIRCTPDHKFLTTAGWQEARSLVGLTTLSLSAGPSKNSGASVTTFAEDTSSAMVSDCIASYGSLRTALSLTASTFITWITTARITLSAISNASRLLSISAGGMAMLQRSADAALSSLLPRRLVNGTGAGPGRLGIGSIITSIARRFSMWNALSFVSTAGGPALRESMAGVSAPTSASPPFGGHQASMMRSGPASSVAPDSSPTAIRSSRLARENVALFPALGAGPVCLSLAEAGKADVYCLTVPETGNFELGNGIVVANCADEVRYACMSRPFTNRVEQPEDRSPFLVKNAFRLEELH